VAGSVRRGRAANCGLEPDAIPGSAPDDTNQKIVLDALSRIECNLQYAPNPKKDEAPLLTRAELADDAAESIGDEPELGASSPYHVPIRLRQSQFGQEVAKSIATWLGQQSGDSYMNTTLWDKLVGELLPNLRLAIVPKVDTAQIIPFVPGLRSAYDISLDMSSISQPTVQTALTRPLRGVGVIAPGTSTRTNASVNQTPLRLLGGWFAPADSAVGMTQFVQPPPWLAQVPHVMSVDTQRADRTLATGALPALNMDNAHVDDEQWPELADYYNWWARSCYAHEMLRGRTGVFTGKVRFDIAPGTTLRIGARESQHIRDDAANSSYVGQVLSVSGQISSAARQAYTQFQVAYLRTSSENEVDATSVERHPLYEDVFVGAPLLHAYKFD